MTDEDSGPWAVTSLGIRSATFSVDEIGRRIGQPTADKKVWSAHFESDSDTPLSDELAQAERFLADKIDVLEKLAPSCEIWLFTSWTPKAGQDHAVYSPTLVKLLGRIGARITLDTWIDEGGEDGDARAG